MIGPVEQWRWPLGRLQIKQIEQWMMKNGDDNFGDAVIPMSGLVLVSSTGSVSKIGLVVMIMRREVTAVKDDTSKWNC